jgi:predicted ATPase
LNFLSTGPKRMPLHQHTLRAMLDWSFNLLSPDLQTLFCRVSVFDGSFTAYEVEALCPGQAIQTGLPALVDHSLLEQRISADGETRFEMFGLAREYASERLSVQAK